MWRLERGGITRARLFPSFTEEHRAPEATLKFSQVCSFNPHLTVLSYVADVFVISSCISDVCHETCDIYADQESGNQMKAIHNLETIHVFVRVCTNLEQRSFLVSTRASRISPVN